MEKIVIGSTRAGLTLKKDLIAYLESKCFQVDDVGMKEDGEFVPYHKSAAAVAKAISEKQYDKGIIICGTGAGSVITAAKFRGVYPVHVTNIFTAQQAKAINNCNVLVFGEWLSPAKHACLMLDTWLTAEFTEGNTEDWKIFLKNCVKEIGELEEEHFK
ncbi:MAG: RpiB/LacA/LacB family sugar-phosphate isomerase [Dysgonamonadaceae bacterium]|jgi:ribose 5-phosphate isomerase B|nr:RpiB/LacA/LacB family sugar-phosphate isomerase [Dysgonamonadaceae bacterium]